MKKTVKCLVLALIVIILGSLSGCKLHSSVTNSINPPQNTINDPAVPAPSPTPEPTPAPEPSKPDSAPVPAENQTRSWWFTRNQQHQVPTTSQEAVQLLSQNNGFYCLPNSSKKIYLTFDCGYELGYTSTILDILDRQNVKAAFFITGQFIETRPDLVKRMNSAGHLVCSHTWSHPDLSTISHDSFTSELSRLERKYTEVTGAQINRYLRPPMGNYSITSLKWTNEAGYRTVFWSMAFEDWDPNKQPGAEYSYQHVTSNIHPGAVILLHAVSKSDTEALERIITELRAQGYIFSTF